MIFEPFTSCVDFLFFADFLPISFRPKNKRSWISDFVLNTGFGIGIFFCGLKIKNEQKELQKMHLFSDVCQNIQQFGLIKLTIFIILSHQIAEATDYCSLCDGHVACRYYGVCFC